VASNDEEEEGSTIGRDGSKNRISCEKKHTRLRSVLSRAGNSTSTERMSDEVMEGGF
jgi:hypothetical protein